MPMLCNDVEYNVTEVMYNALRYLRLEGRERYLWIDAVCIDQYNETEKSWQVKNMLMIFQKASGVVAWLGLPEPGEETLFAFIHQMEDMDREDIGGEDIGGEDIGGEDIGGEDIGGEDIGGEDIVGEDIGCRDHDTSCQAILAKLQLVMEDILKRPWFQRTWVRQEIFAAKSTQVQLGDLKIRLQKFYSGVEFLRNQDNSVDVPKNFDILMQDSKLLRQESLNNITPVRSFVAHALGVLAANTFFRATDAQDRIYGLLGMILDPRTLENLPEGPDIMQHPYPVDYGKIISSVYRDVIRFVIRGCQNLEILHVFQDRKALASDFQSWVIDWTRCVPRYYPDTEFKVNKASWAAQREQWRKSYGSTSAIPTHIPGVLPVRGRAVARVVSKVGPIQPLDLEVFWLRGLDITCSTFHGSKVAHNGTPDMGSKACAKLLQDCSYTGFNISWSANPKHYVDKEDADHTMTDERLAESDRHFWGYLLHLDLAFCSDLVQEGDLLVYLQGLESAVCLRRLQEFPEDRFVFLGPAILLPHWDRDWRDRRGRPAYFVALQERPVGLDKAFLKISDPLEREFILV